MARKAATAQPCWHTAVTWPQRYPHTLQSPSGAKGTRAFLRNLSIGLAPPHARVQLLSSVQWTRRTQPISTTKRQDSQTLLKKS